MVDSASAISVNALVFSGGEVWSEDEPTAQANAILQTLAQSVSGPSSADESRRSEEERTVSTYVRVFEGMISTIIKEETHLFDDEEFALLTLFAHLSYNARFLMVKLLLRKQETWHRLDKLKYEGELGSVSAIAKAIDELCQVGTNPSCTIKKEDLEEQLRDVGPTMDKSAVRPQQEQDKPASIDVGASEPSARVKPIALARNEKEMDLKSLLECLKLDELKAVAKQLKLKTNQKKDVLIRDLLGASSSQSTLAGYACRDGVARSKSCSDQQTKLTFGNPKSQQDRLKEIALGHIIKCVRVDDEFFGVIHRVYLVYFRMTQYTPNLPVAALLTCFGKRSYPGYEYKRTNNVWPSRQALIDYEEVLILEAQVDTLLSGDAPSLSGGAAGSKFFAARLFPTPVTPGNAGGSGEGEGLGNEDTIPDFKPDTMRVRGARMVKDIFEREFFRWQNLVKTEGEEGRRDGLERFHHGHVLTRIICKGSAALGILGEHARELEVLETLLAQKRWRRGQRGKWYDRRALILSTRFPKDLETTERAFDAVVEALRDPDTHMVYRPKLQKRLKKLENKLQIPLKERHTCDGALVDAGEVFFEGVRLRHRAASLKLDRIGRCIDVGVSQQSNQDIKRYYSPVAVTVKPEPSSSSISTPRRESPSSIPKGKSLWSGRNGEELTVEALALQHYKEQGFKGVHCESRIMAMLFGLLFWDIIFSPIPGAFETPYQTAPLDIAEESFYHARKDLMEKRLAAIEHGKGADFIRDVDAQHRASGTWCVGVKWDLFTSEELIDIVMCIGGRALSVICRVLCEDYTFGMSGGPDLFLWNAEKGTCKFVEVKGPGDTLHENQRVWIDILLKAPVDVEICRVMEKGQEADRKPSARTPKSTRRKAGETPRKQEGILVDEEDADALPNIFCDLHDATVEEYQAQTNVCTFPARVDLHITTPSTSTRIKETPGPSKRKASPPEATPSKKPRTS